jgi:hypothetical protein
MKKPDPYKKRSPGDVITAEDWNDMQSEARLHIHKHTHTGDQHGTQLSGEAIKPDSGVTLKNLSVENGFIMGFSPLFDKTPENQDQEAMELLKTKPPGTFLIAGPCATDESSFRIYWKPAEDKYNRFDIFKTKGMGTIKSIGE